MNRKKLEIVGVILWWGEGTKSRRDKRWKNARSYPIEFTNTNPIMIKVFLDFLREVVHIEETRLRVQIQIHEGDDQERLEAFWSELTQIPRSQFNKTIVRPVGKKVGKSNGTCKIRFVSKEVYLQIEGMLKKALIDTFGKLPSEHSLPHYEFLS